MKFSTRTRYGLKAALALAARFGEGSLSAAQIARRQGISVSYLEQILNRLKRKGFVKSVRGPQGGYVLSRKPAEITLEALLATLDEGGPSSNGAPSPAADEVAIADHLFWQTLHASIGKGLSGVSLKELVDEARRIKKGKSSGPYSFHI
jgi:Rrf2 family iron-sulfur cluster assembly transcriptional regulator